jgi:hypothetical protein
LQLAFCKRVTSNEWRVASGEWRVASGESWNDCNVDGHYQVHENEDQCVRWQTVKLNKEGPTIPHYHRPNCELSNWRRCVAGCAVVVDSPQGHSSRSQCLRVQGQAAKH